MIPPFPEVVDSTIRSALVSCHRQFYWGHLRHLRRAGKSLHLHFGGCFAKAIEATRRAYYQYGKSIEDAMAAGTEVAIVAWGDYEVDAEMPAGTRAGYKTLAACIDALWTYFERWPLDTDKLQPYRLPNGDPAIEMSFALPIENTIHPITGNPIIYAGRYDMLAVWDNESIFVCDEKTSSALGNAWRKNWSLRGQLSGYCYSLREYGLNPSGAIIRGLGILSGEITTEEVFETRPQWQIDQWYRQLQDDINHAIDAWCDMEKSGDPRSWLAWGQALDAACSSYGGCQFLDLCDSEFPERWIGEFQEVIWDPLHRQVESS